MELQRGPTEINKTLVAARRENRLHHEIITRLTRATIHFWAGDATFTRLGVPEADGLRRVLVADRTVPAPKRPSPRGG